MPLHMACSRTVGDTRRYSRHGPVTRCGHSKRVLFVHGEPTMPPRPRLTSLNERPEVVDPFARQFHVSLPWSAGVAHFRTHPTTASLARLSPARRGDWRWNLFERD